MTMQHEVALDPYDRLRAAARERSEDTVARLEAGIRALEGRREVVTARTIERETGLTFKTIQRNAAAYELYKAAAEAFRSGPNASHRRRHRRSNVTTPPLRDSLLAYKKPQLANRLRLALKRIEELETALAVQTGACQEQHVRIIMGLTADVARLERATNVHQPTREGDQWP
jgi:hypothetical protein